jgi:hypothetical protein
LIDGVLFMLLLVVGGRAQLLAIPISIIEDAFKTEHQRAMKNAAIHEQFSHTSVPKVPHPTAHQHSGCNINPDGFAAVCVCVFRHETLFLVMGFCRTWRSRPSS